MTRFLMDDIIDIAEDAAVAVDLPDHLTAD